MMTKLDFEKLFMKRLGAIKPGLGRMKSASEVMGNPSQNAHNILVGGTNGKGGCSAFLWSLLATRRVGLFTSPHLVSFTERMQVSGENIDELQLSEVHEQLQTKLGDGYEDLSFFEVATLMAYQLFHQKNCQFNVMEVGLGGRWDCTNIVEPEASIICSISRDHEQFLGSDLKGILQEKLGICRPHVPLFWGASGEVLESQEALDYLEEHTKEKNIPLHSWGVNFGIDGDRFFCGNKADEESYSTFPKILDTAPSFIRRNFVMAVACYDYLSKRHGLQHWKTRIQGFPYADIQAPNSLVGRFQRVTLDDKYVIFDVCHNPDGMRQLSQNIKAKEANAKTAIISILRDKKFDEILDIAKQCFSKIYLFAIEHDRGFGKGDLASRHHDLEFFEDFDASWTRVKQDKGTEPLVICGSVMAVGKVFEQFNLDPKQYSCQDVLQGTWP